MGAPGVPGGHRGGEGSLLERRHQDRDIAGGRATALCREDCLLVRKVRRHVLGWPDCRYPCRGCRVRPPADAISEAKPRTAGKRTRFVSFAPSNLFILVDCIGREMIGVWQSLAKK